MSYIWNDYSNQKYYELAVENIVSGVEVWNTETKNTLVNVLPRLFDLFFSKSFIDSEEKYNNLVDDYKNNPEYKDFFNLIIHFQSMFDRNSGFSIYDIYSMYIEKRILNNEFGEKIKELYLSCNSETRYILLNCYSEYLLSGNRKNMFEKFLELNYKLINIYHQKSSEVTYVYIHKEKNEKDIDTVNLAKYFLCDIKRNIEIMWEGEHLPFIGYDYTMVLGEMYLG